MRAPGLTVLAVALSVGATIMSPANAEQAQPKYWIVFNICAPAGCLPALIGPYNNQSECVAHSGDVDWQAIATEKQAGFQMLGCKKVTQPDGTPIDAIMALAKPGKWYSLNGKPAWPFGDGAMHPPGPGVMSTMSPDGNVHFSGILAR